jgi:hypothetical protein
MATVIDLLRHLGQHAAPDGDNALAGPITLPGVTDSALALPLPPAIITAWTRLVGRTTLGHHALALSAAQTQHSVALMGHGAAAHHDLLLLVLSQLQRQPQPAMLYITPHGASLFRAQLIKLVESLGVRWLDAAKPGARIGQAQLILATPTDLHRRVLRYHDRAWRWLWSQIRFVALPELHGYTGVEAGQLHWLLRRVERLASHAPLQILSSLAPVADAGATLSRLLDRSLQVVAAPDGPSHNTLVALWRCGNDRSGTIMRLAEQLTARRLAITVLGRDAAETQQLQDLVTGKGIALPQEARVAIVAGIPRAIDDRQSLLRSGYRLLLLLAGDEPHELLFAAQPDLLLNALPHWPQGTGNPYIVAPQLLCAAVERPLEEVEIDRWGVLELRDRLIKKGTLQPLPSGELWQAAPDVDDPYAEVDPQAIGGPLVVVHNPNGQVIDSISPALLDRCALPNQVFEPGLRVAQRDEHAQTVQLAPDPVERATVVLTEMKVQVREELVTRSIRFGKQTTDLSKGKVLATQQIIGLRELRPDATQQQISGRVPQTQWLAAACWLPLVTSVADPQTLGWTITQVLPLVSLAPPAALAPAYDAANQRLYLIETEPGGVGLVDCIYQQFETVIELALQLAQAAVSRPLYQQLAASELAWLHRLYGRAAPVQVERPAQPAPQATSERREPQPAVVIAQTTSSERKAAPSQQSRPQPSVAIPAKPIEPQPSVRIPVPARPIEPQPSVRVPVAQAQPGQPETQPKANGQTSTPRQIPADQRPAPQQPAGPARTNPTSPAPQQPAGPTRTNSTSPAPQQPAGPARTNSTSPAPRPIAGTTETRDNPAASKAETPRIEPKTAPPVVPLQPVANVESGNRAAPPAAPDRRASVYAAPKPTPAHQPTPRPDIRLEPNEVGTAPQTQDRVAEQPGTPIPAQAAAKPVPRTADAQDRIEQAAQPASRSVDGERIAEQPVAEEAQDRAQQPQEAARPTTDVRVQEQVATYGPTTQRAEPRAERPQKQIEAAPVAPEAIPAPATPADRDEAPTQPVALPSASERIVERPALPPVEPERPKDTAPSPTASESRPHKDTVPSPTASESRPHVETPPGIPPASNERRRSAAQYRIEDLLPPVEDEDEADTASFEEQDETTIEEPPAQSLQNGKPQPILNRDTGRRRDQQQQTAERIDAQRLDTDAADEMDDLPPIRRGVPPRSETPPPQRRTSQPARPERPTRPRGEPQRPFSDRRTGRYAPGGAPPQREEPPKARPDQRPYQSRNGPNQPPTNQQRRGPAPTNQRAPVEPTPPRSRQPVAPGRDETIKPRLEQAQPPAAPEPEADVNAMIARMRRLRQERETAQQQTAPRPGRAAPTEPVELRFHIGERVQCLPYGIGTVRGSRVAAGREQVMIHFPEYGEIEVDPALNLIRRLGSAATDEQNEQDE